ncbi:MAG: hypothetical protein A2879_03635 [Omnitrophica WOR_2 bacterium RIFCSPHIGHO2_01_FULL_49_10]|nr:MAG: hypothetical protein A2879_03635 [Omnitrophica WOR_2 bacterium RIFCSPHIGHO2_01_FULL_49_10]
MKFEEIMDRIKGIEFDAIRVKSQYYFEAIILRDKLPVLAERLEKLFGKQLCPPEKKLPPDAEKVAGAFGGVMGDQTLYFLKENEYSYFAMLWPWSDDCHITVKLGRK